MLKLANLKVVISFPSDGLSSNNKKWSEDCG